MATITFSEMKYLLLQKKTCYLCIFWAGFLINGRYFLFMFMQQSH